jgi:hypothetical protein
VTALLLAIVLAQPPAVTPGAVRSLSLATICATKWGKDHRFVSEGMKQEVFRRQGLPWSDRANWEVDHRVPRSLAGADVLDNLWAQPLGQAKHLKDPLEVRLSKMVCHDGLPLAEAQQAFLGDWVVAYRHYYGRAPQ